MTAAPAIVEVALNGQTSKQLNPNVPRSSAEIAACAIACIEAGASDYIAKPVNVDVLLTTLWRALQATHA